MRSTFFLAALVTVVVAAPVPPSYAAQAETCRGEPATIVRHEAGGVVRGTGGDDVIVVTGDQGVEWVGIDAANGDDLICFGGDVPEGVAVDAKVDVTGGLGDDVLVYVGTAGQDRVVVAGVDHLDVRTGEGIDRVDLDGNIGGDGLVDGGPESSPRNTLRVSPLRDGARVSIDVGAGTAAVDGVAFSMSGFDRVEAWATDVVLTGGGDKDKLLVRACRARVRGLGGADSLGARVPFRDCTHPDVRLLGGAGDDRMVGSAGPDTLVGGAGRDRAIGRQGRDRCDAEIEQECER
jgi:Ca2+-binding RTX toxin-like protein